MTNFEDRGKDFAVGGDLDSAIAVEHDVVVVETGKAPRERRNPFAALPLLLGVLFLIVNVVIFLRVPTSFNVKNSSGSMSLLLLLMSVATCLVLIIYGLAARRGDGDLGGGRRARFLRSVGLPLLLGLLAPLFTLWGLQVNKATAERISPSTTSCIEVYEKASAIAKDNPRFRMPATDRDEIRCTVNAVLGR